MPVKSPVVVVPHQRVFDRVVVFPYVRGGTTATWWLHPLFNETGPYQFYLEWGEHPEDNAEDPDFVTVAGPTTGNTLIDVQQRKFSKVEYGVYRVRLETGRGVHYSAAHLCAGNLVRHDYLIVKDIVRREFLGLQKLRGTRGILLSRKHWGELCPQCLDYQTGMVTDEQCPVCYGTKYVGGYHAPQDMWMAEERLERRTRRDEPIGMNSNRTQLATTVAYPFLNTEDVWVSTQQDMRWFVQSCNDNSSFRGVPVLFNVELRLAPPSDIIYDVPIVQSTASSSSSGS